MKKFVIRKTVLPVIVAIMLAGCAGKDVSPVKSPEVRLGHFAAGDENEAVAVAKNFAGAFEKSLMFGDFKHLEPLLPAAARGKGFTAAEFAGMRGAMIKLYGNPRKLTYATTLKQGKLRDVLWKIAFEHKDRPGEMREILLCVRIFREPGKKPGVAGFFIKRF